jgi:hypothetical protein
MMRSESGVRVPPSMSTCPIHTFLPSGSTPGGMPEVLAASGLPVTLPEVMELVSQHPLIAIAVAAVFGLLVGWLTRPRSPKESEAARTGPRGLEELRWRHEKLVLTERQQVEKQSRLDAFVSELDPSANGLESSLRFQVFLLTERLREARQKVGSDLSRMRETRERLGAVLPSLERGRESVEACRGMAEVQATRLEEARELLREIAEEARTLEERVFVRSPLAAPAAVRRDFMALKGRLLTLPQGWATSSEETDRRLRELLATVDHPDLAPVREILLVDGALTASLAGASTLDLTGAVSAVIGAVDRLASAKEAPHPEPAHGEAHSVEAPLESPAATSGIHGDFADSVLDPPEPAENLLDFGFPEPNQPDPSFRCPSEFTPLSVRLSKGFRDLTQGNGNGNGNGFAHAGDADLVAELTSPPAASIPGESDDSERTLVLFCSNNVELWGQTVYRGSRCRARAIAEFPEWARWVSIRRLDTNERVFAPILTASLRTAPVSDPFGFNGTNELFYGARHLGLFSESCPNEVETRFTYGGWGFGHRAHEIAPEVEQLQAAGWEGREIPADTVFEIVIHEELPSLGQRDRILDGEVRAVR